ncbi:hypothetical protein [Paracoccus cavernae]
MKRRLILLLALAVLCLGVAGPAALGRLALVAGLPSLAVPLLASPLERGVALYRAGDYAAADAAFAEAGRSQTYNRGLSLAAVGEYPLSVAYFDAVLFVNPADAEARRNRELVLTMYPPHQGDSVVPGRISGHGGLEGGGHTDGHAQCRGRARARMATRDRGARDRGQRRLAGDDLGRSGRIFATSAQGGIRPPRQSGPDPPARGGTMVKLRLLIVLFVALLPALVRPVMAEDTLRLVIPDMRPVVGEMIPVTIRGEYTGAISLSSITFPDSPLMTGYRSPATVGRKSGSRGVWSASSSAASRFSRVFPAV